MAVASAVDVRLVSEAIGGMIPCSVAKAAQSSIACRGAPRMAAADRLVQSGQPSVAPGADPELGEGFGKEGDRDATGEVCEGREGCEVALADANGRSSGSSSSSGPAVGSRSSTGRGVACPRK